MILKKKQQQYTHLAVFESRRLGKPRVPVRQILFLGPVWIINNDESKAVPPNSWPARLVTVKKI
jgi:hypothetical protein